MFDTKNSFKLVKVLQIMSTITLTIWTRQRSRAGLEVGGGSGGEESIIQLIASSRHSMVDNAQT